ncbi:MAG TPA: DEDD exonuclease domain-containing protein [Candidatus Kapabacteria bacterium]|nr:DEDD exonuclease domain-containing protein [Candidatus Kapabacteria bacterium]
MLLGDASFIVVDVETTGLSAANHRITEIALVRLEAGAITGSFQTLVNPEQHISSFITQHTGITNAMVFGKPRFGDVATEIKSFFAKTASPVLGGHNVKFDHGFLVQSFAREGHTFELASGPICTCRLARRLLPQLRSKSLKSVQDYFGIKNPRQHRALGDAEATANILARFIELASEMEIETLEDFLRLQYAKPNYARRKTKREGSLREKVKAFPERPGVYTMTSADGTVLYVGKAKNLHNRIASYFSQSNTEGTKLTKMMRAVRDITYEETGSELSALLLESRKIKEHRPRFNTLDRWYKPQSFMRLDVQTDFPELTFIREPVPDGAEYYGPFQSREAAEALMEILNRAFKLRECGDKFKIGPQQKPCLYYEIDRCGAPCALKQSKDEYRMEVRKMQEFLAAGDEGILSHVEQIMRASAERLDFEEAEFYKRRLFELRRVLGTGGRESASVSGNDFVILNPIDPTQCEVLFVRFGQLLKQITLGTGHLAIAEQWFARQLRIYYGATSAIPPSAGKPEIDEMRILARWVESSRKKGSRIIYIEQDWEASVKKLVHELKELFNTNSSGTNSAAILSREKKLVLRPMNT